MTTTAPTPSLRNKEAEFFQWWKQKINPRINQTGGWTDDKALAELGTTGRPGTQIDHLRVLLRRMADPRHLHVEADKKTLSGILAIIAVEECNSTEGDIVKEVFDQNGDTKMRYLKDFIDGAYTYKGDRQGSG